MHIPIHSGHGDRAGVLLSVLLHELVTRRNLSGDGLVVTSLADSGFPGIFRRVPHILVLSDYIGRFGPSHSTPQCRRRPVSQGFSKSEEIVLLARDL